MEKSNEICIEILSSKEWEFWFRWLCFVSNQIQGSKSVDLLVGINCRSTTFTPVTMNWTVSFRKREAHSFSSSTKKKPRKFLSIKFKFSCLECQRRDVIKQSVFRWDSIFLYQRRRRPATEAIQNCFTMNHEPIFFLFKNVLWTNCDFKNPIVLYFFSHLIERAGASGCARCRWIFRFYLFIFIYTQKCCFVYFAPLNVIHFRCRPSNSTISCSPSSSSSCAARSVLLLPSVAFFPHQFHHFSEF